ncbi:MAG: hypothetical protein JWM28_622 [Chitinophagaceae bacterium]|nr:hypothetical protein [Chitinophagaceae bacterium]
MKSKSEWLVLTTASYFTCWFILLVVYHLSGLAQISGGIISLWAFSTILSSLRDSLGNL